MSDLFHEVDPNGDVTLVLQNPDEPFAVWSDFEDPPPARMRTPRAPGAKKKKKKKSMPSFESLDPASDEPAADEPAAEEPAAEEPAADEPAADEPAADEPATDEPTTGEPATGEIATGEPDPDPHDNGDKPEVEIRLRLSSKHLILASKPFEKMFRGPWKESSASPSPITLTESGWSIEATLILMNIIHGRVRSVPRSVDLEMLARIAVLVDYYDCHEVVELFVDCWIRELSNGSPKRYGRDLILWLVVSRVFAKSELFETITKVVVMESRGPIQTLKLPIPEGIVCEWRRKKRRHWHSVRQN